ncbi:FAD-dependent monooxygenase [Streptomyces sp. NPDC047072]|uniref:FAD-dependent monooxygenase n=1 Tax=Streptomyces sp. NPDC047072 TaxID=3154809 RepID=UPI0033EE5C8A
MDAEVDVLIVGGGPVGLTARLLLERWGVRVEVVEKRRELSPFPRSRLVNVRSMEIFRGLGLAEGIARQAFAAEYGSICFRDTLYDRDFAAADLVGVRGPVPESPVTGVVTSQDRLEPLLLAAGESPVRFGAELVGLAEESDGVTASLVDRASGAESRVRASYVLGADGANSTVRELLGIGTDGPGALGSFTTVVFDADLGHWEARRPAGVYITAHGTFLPLYPEGGWALFGATPDDPGRADWAETVSRALGPRAEGAVKVLRVQHWVMNAFVADRLRSGRVLLAGDAAHSIPITGGLGMNTGLADVHNLVWKMAGVLRGWASPALLDSYGPERLSVAHRTLQQAVENARLMIQVQTRRQEQLRAGDVSAPVELPWSERYFAQLGLVLGVSYRSTAVFGAGGSGETGTEYVPTAQPGHRVPHLWLGGGRSTLDAFGEWFTLLTADAGHWGQLTVGDWPLRVECLPEEHALGLPPQGALLVRPDGHVAARWDERPPADTALRDALGALTGC